VRGAECGLRYWFEHASFRGARGGRYDRLDLTGPLKHTGGRSTLPASAVSGLGGGYSLFNVACFRGARGGRHGRLGAQGEGHNRLDLSGLHGAGRGKHTARPRQPPLRAGRTARARAHLPRGSCDGVYLTGLSGAPHRPQWRSSPAFAAHGVEGRGLVRLVFAVLECARVGGHQLAELALRGTRGEGQDRLDLEVLGGEWGGRHDRVELAGLRSAWGGGYDRLEIAILGWARGGRQDRLDGSTPPASAARGAKSTSGLTSPASAAHGAR